MEVSSAWAVLKVLVAGLLAPVGFPLVMWLASVNHRRARAMTRVFAHQVAAVTGGRAPGPPANRVRRIGGPVGAVIVSDLHRCMPGARDWPGRQDTAGLYEAMLDHYTAAGAHVVENGDTEDFWMIGGSRYGAGYDLARLLTTVVRGRVGRRLRRRVYRRHLRRIVDHHHAIYGRLRALAAAGRFHRLVGNHDDVFLDRELAETYRIVVGTSPVDWLVMEDGAGHTAAVITHGHQTDGWNAPGRAFLGRLATWLANTLNDVPGLDSPEPLPGRDATTRVLRGRRANGLLRVSPTFGANANYDSLDEELLFDALGGAATAGPWLILGHTHAPVISPLSRTGARWLRYANSGHGIWKGMITAVEWDGTDAQLVAWLWADHPAVASNLPAQAELMVHRGREVARVVLLASPDGAILIAA